MNLSEEQLLRDFRSPDEIHRAGQDIGYIHKRLEARERNAVLFRRLEREHNNRVREERDKAFAKEAWLRSGGREQDFDGEWSKITTEERSSRIREAERAASDAMLRRVKDL